MSTNQPSGQPVGGWEGAKTCQNSNAGSFFGNWRGALDYGGRLWRDCGDATLSLRLPHRYRESFCLACAAGVRIKKKHLKTQILDAFSTDGAREACFGKNPHPAEAWPPNGFARGWGGGGGGRRNPQKLEFWRLFGRRQLFKSSRIQDSHAPGTYFHPAVSRSPIATTTLHHTACGSMVATGYAKTRAAFEFWRFFCS